MTCLSLRPGLRPRPGSSAPRCCVLGDLSSPAPRPCTPSSYCSHFGPGNAVRWGLISGKCWLEDVAAHKLNGPLLTPLALGFLRGLGCPAWRDPGPGFGHSPGISPRKSRACCVLRTSAPGWGGKGVFPTCRDLGEGPHFMPKTSVDKSGLSLWDWSSCWGS